MAVLKTNSAGVTGVSLRTLAGASVAAAIFAAALSAAPASAAQNLTTCKKVSGDQAIRLPSKAVPCDSVTTVNTSVVSKTTYYTSVKSGGKWKWSVAKALPKGCKVTATPTNANQCKTDTVWQFSPKAVPLPTGCTISNTPGAKKCKLVRAATESVLLFKADPVRFSANGKFSSVKENLPTDLKSFSIASVDFLASCSFDDRERLVVSLAATSPLAATSTSSGITMTSQTRAPFTATSAVQTTAATLALSPFGGEQTYTPIDKGLVVSMSGLGADALGMFTYIVDVGAATITLNASVRVNSPAMYYEEGDSLCSISGSGFATLDS